MSFASAGDSLITHEMVLRLRRGDGPDAHLPALGFLTGLYSFCGQHDSDNVVEPEWLTIVAPETHQERVKQIVDAGFAKWQGRGKARRLVLINNRDLFYVLTREEKKRRKERGSSKHRTYFKIPVWVRDGDQCRWCGRVVNAYDHTSGDLGKNLDHVLHSKPIAETIDDLVVACSGCNGSRARDWQLLKKELATLAPEDLEDAFTERYSWTLLPVPEHPFYQPSTVTWLAQHGVPVQSGPHPAVPTNPRLHEPSATAGTEPAVGSASPQDEPSAAAGTEPPLHEAPMQDEPSAAAGTEPPAGSTTLPRGSAADTEPPLSHGSGGSTSGRVVSGRVPGRAPARAPGPAARAPEQAPTAGTPATQEPAEEPAPQEAEGTTRPAEPPTRRGRRGRSKPRHLRQAAT